MSSAADVHQGLASICIWTCAGYAMFWGLFKCLVVYLSVVWCCIQMLY